MTFAAPSDHEIVLTGVVDAPRALVFEAWTNPEHLMQWFGPRGWTLPICEIDLRPGGTRHFVSRRPQGTEIRMRGVYREITPPERLVYTESYDDDPDHLGELLITLILSEDDGRTTITSRVRYPSKEARDAELTRVPEGWSESFDRLAEYVPTMA